MRALLACAIILLSCVATLASSALAQRAAPSGVRGNDRVPAVSVRPANLIIARPESAGQAHYEIPVRTAMGLGGAVVGAFAGALVGANVPRAPCNCEDPGLEEALDGALVGSLLLSAVIASAPQFSSNCSQLRRLSYGLVGAMTAGLAGGALGATMGAGGMFLGYFAGAGVGAGVGSGMCR